jgi:hypothetical protein
LVHFGPYEYPLGGHIMLPFMHKHETKMKSGLYVMLVIKSASM